MADIRLRSELNRYWGPNQTVELRALQLGIWTATSTDSIGITIVEPSLYAEQTGADDSHSALSAAAKACGK